jgi:hypothetical protein
VLLDPVATDMRFRLSETRLFLDGLRDGMPFGAPSRLTTGVSMNSSTSRRKFLANASVLSAPGMIGPSVPLSFAAASHFGDQTVPDYTVRICASAVDIGNKHIVSAVTYNDQFPARSCDSRKASR